MKLNVLQIQQWLTDISATRGLDGLNDGFIKAQENAKAAKGIITELKTLYPERSGELVEIEKNSMCITPRFIQQQKKGQAP